MPAETGSAGGGQSLHLGKYRLLAKLAEGGMGELYLASLEAVGGFEKLTVLKLIHRRLSGRRRAVDEFLREARIAARLSHPNICHSYELGEHDGEYFLAMEYLEGLPLHVITDLIGEGGEVLPPRVCGAIVQQVCEGLHYAHTFADLDGSPAPIIHRDISPQNVFLTVDGFAKLLDFGLAKTDDTSHTPVGRLRGKVAYMAPEQTLGDLVDARTDVFSLGVVFHELLSGQRLFRRENKLETLRAVHEATYPFVDIGTGPGPLDSVIARAMERDPDNRYQTAREFSVAIGEALEESGGPMSQAALGAWFSTRFARQLERRRQQVGRLMESADPSRTPVEDITGVWPKVGSDFQRSPIVAGIASIEAVEITEQSGDAIGERENPTESLTATPTPEPAPARPPAPIAPREAAPNPRRRHPTPPPMVAIPTAPMVVSSTERVRTREPRWRAAPIVGSVFLIAALAAMILWITADSEQPLEARSAMPEAPATDRAAESDHRDPPPGDRESTPGDRDPTPGDQLPVTERGRPARDAEGGAAPPRKRAASPPRHSRTDAASGPGYFTIDSVPYANIFVDGASIGATPIFRHRLKPGRHTVRAVTEDGQSKQWAVTIESEREAPRRRLTW